MALVPTSLVWLSIILGKSEGWLERYFRALRIAGLIPLGKPGGGKGAPRYDELSLAYILLGFAGQLPSDAPNAVKALRTLPFRWDSHKHLGGEPLPTLEDMLVSWIVSAGEARRNDADWFPEDKAVLLSWNMQLCLDPLSAIITVRLKDGSERKLLYVSDPNAPQPVLRKLTIISGSVLLGMGEMLADPTKRVGKSTTFLDQLYTNAAPGSENADVPYQETSAPFESQSRTTGTDNARPSVSDVTYELHSSQGGAPGGEAGSSVQNDRSVQTDRRFLCPIPTAFL